MAAPQPARNYELKSDLARMCLPAEFKDSYRFLAYANSVCFLFLVVGLIGLKTPELFIRDISPAPDPIPVVLNEPEVVPPERTPEPEEFTPPTDQPVETPQVQVVVAVPDSPDVTFAVPVTGAVVVAASPRAATPPPPGQIVRQAAPPTPTAFNPRTIQDGGYYPPPNYPAKAQRDQQEGTVVVEIAVAAAGDVKSARVFKSSGHLALDDAALAVVKNLWKFPPGQERLYRWSCVFNLR